MADIVLVYGVDTPASVKMLARAEVEELGLLPADLRSLAVRNLLRMHDLVRIAGYPRQTHLMVVCGGSYEASMLLADELWAEIDPHLDGDPVVAVPTRDLLLIGDSAHPRMLESMRQVVETLPAEAYAISHAWLIRRDGRWERYA